MIRFVHKLGSMRPFGTKKTKQAAKIGGSPRIHSWVYYTWQGSTERPT